MPPLRQLLERLLRLLSYLCTALWVLCAALTGLEAFGLLGFATPSVGALVRALTWLLVFGLSPHGVRKWLARVLWWPLLGYIVLGVVTFFWGGFYLLGYLVVLGSGHSTYWETTQVVARRGAWLYVTQRSYEKPMTRSYGSYEERQRVLIPFTRWFYLLRSPGDFAVARWTPINRPASYFLADSTHQLHLDRAQQQRRQCAHNLRALDSLDRLHRLPTARLPAATQRGANTVGCLLQGQVWRNQLGPDSLGSCPQPPAYAFRVYRGLDRDTDLRIAAHRGVSQGLYLLLPYPLPATPSAWPVKVTLVVQAPGAPQAAVWVSRAQSVSLTLTAIDVGKEVLAGTFHGTLYAQEPKRTQRPRTLSLQAGRFDVKYSTWVDN